NGDPGPARVLQAQLGAGRRADETWPRSPWRAPARTAAGRRQPARAGHGLAPPRRRFAWRWRAWAAIWRRPGYDLAPAWPRAWGSAVPVFRLVSGPAWWMSCRQS
ncbi:unnamed protein product, partial [Amoebophrya sp. A120]